MECVRKLFSRRKLLRLGRAQCLRTDHTIDARWYRKFRVQNARSLSALNQARAGKADHRRRVRMRLTQSTHRSRPLGAVSARRSFFKSLAADCRFLLVERRLAE